MALFRLTKTTQSLSPELNDTQLECIIIHNPIIEVCLKAMQCFARRMMHITTDITYFIHPDGISEVSITAFARATDVYVVLFLVKINDARHESRFPKHKNRLCLLTAVSRLLTEMVSSN
jgi:hypothetical protein